MFATGLVLAWMLLTWHPGALALDPSLEVSQYAHTAWKVRDGFFKGSINAIAQTPDGYLWLGTEFGPVLFDGVRAVRWQPPPDQHLPPGRIVGLLGARDGTLWFGTDTGLASWKDDKLTQYPEFAGQSVYSLLEDRQGTVWAGSFGTPTGKLCAIQNGGVRCYGEDGSLGPGVFTLYEGRQGDLWAGLQDGLWRWRPDNPEFYPVPKDLNGVRPLGEDEDGTLLIGLSSGIRRFVDGKLVPYPLPDAIQQAPVTMMLRDRDGGLWVATHNRGLAHLHRGRAVLFTEADGLSGDSVIKLFEDREGNVWAATTSGLDRFRDFAVATFTAKQGLLDAPVGSILAAADGSLWLGTLRSLSRWHDGQFTPFGDQDGKLNGLAPNSLFQDRRGRIWVSTNSGLGYLENDRMIPVGAVPGGFVHSIVEDGAGDIWIANQQSGLIRLRGEAVEQFPWAALGRKDYAWSVVADPRQGGLWLGFSQGDVAYFADGGVRAWYTAKDGLGAGRVNGFMLDPDGTLWVATEGGLSRLKNGRIATLKSEQGLPCDTVHWVMEGDDHSFWLYTPCGLVRVARSEVDAWAAAVEKGEDTRQRVRVTVLDSSDGVRSRVSMGGYVPHVAKTADGRLWFLPQDGVSVVDPLRLPVNRIPPPVSIEQVTADRKPYDATQGLRLPPSVRDVAIDYTALSFVAPEKVRFRYKLEGYDSDWQEAGNRRQAFYTNLPPRGYRFRVMAANDSGVWNEEGAALDFSIEPAFYQTNWFRALAAALLVALLFAGYRLRVHRLRQQERKFRETLETIPAMAFVAGPEGSRTFVNRHWVDYTGLSVEQSSGSGWQAAVHPEDLARTLDRWRASWATGEPFENELRFRGAADGRYRWFLTRAVPLRDKRGKVLNWYGVTTDIEDRKRAEEERERLHQMELELAHTNRLSLLGELTASLAHEINQPISAAITSAGACLRWLNREQPEVGRAREAAMRIENDGRRAAEIITHLKSFYKKETSPQRERVDINEVAGEMLVLLRSEADRRSVVMRTEFAVDVPPVLADRVQLQQVLMNLMLNGIEAMGGAGGELKIKTGRGEEGVLVSVSDTGEGIPADKMREIFNAFFTTKAGGTGMGLAISRTIIESHGGRLWAEANSGRGATFHFTLPTQPEAQT
ncbi:MAG: PAS domain-containing protein [Acidobacteria bacterium]|nr:PAS domain-containing protein [Acidobacteriota bacterium]